MRVAAVQFAATTDVETNTTRMAELLEHPAAEGADLIVLPEASMHDFGPTDLALGPIAQRVDGPFVAAVGKLAVRRNVTIVAGMFEVSDDPVRPFNTLVVVDADGAVAATYRKAHLYDSFGYQESARLLGGEVAPVVLEVGGLHVGLMTCYDLRFPEFARLLIDQGAEMLVTPAAWVRGPLKEDHWETLLRARAIENTSYVVGAGQTGRMYVGSSMVIDPAGVAIARLGDEEGIAVAEVTAGRVSDVRMRNPSLANRRLPSVR